LIVPIKTFPWDIQDHLKTHEQQLGYLEAVFEDDDPALIAAALGDVAKARGMSAVAKEAGVTRETLYKALSENGDPRLSTFMGVARALGLRLQLSPVPEKKQTPIKRATSKSTTSKSAQPVRKKTIKAA
jgi:probable addiction module antidote protein